MKNVIGKVLGYFRFHFLFCFVFEVLGFLFIFICESINRSRGFTNMLIENLFNLDFSELK